MKSWLERHWKLLGIGAGIVGLATLLKVSASLAPVNVALHSPIFYRSAIARLYQMDSNSAGLYRWTLPNQTLATVTAMLQQFRPSFLTSVTRVEVGKAVFPAQMISDLNAVYNSMKAINPSCVVDVALRGGSYGTNVAQLVADMQATAASGLLFDSFSTYGLPAGDSTPIVQAAQSLGKMLGGLFTSMPSFTPAFQIIEDIGFQPLDQSVSAPWNNAGVPVLFMNQNGATIVTTVPPGFPAPTPSQTEHNYFVLTLSPAQQLQIITSFAQGQVAGGYSYVLPLAFPEGTIGIEDDIIMNGNAPAILSLANGSPQ